MGKKNIVKGVTSAAIIWVLAAIGAAIGLGLLTTAVALTIVAVGVFVGVELLESYFLKLRRGVHADYNNPD
jgi:putative Mg2+ transporter-C (MgtC) family protein